MKAVVQRVSRGSVAIGGTNRVSIERGYVILLGIRHGDTVADARFVAEKCAALRVMEDSAGKMNLNLDDVQGSVIVVSQFTLYGETRRGNRPSFIDAARPEEAEPLYETFVQTLREILGPERVHTGEFRAMMEVTIVNDGPVTILIDSIQNSTGT